jgi:hypothetical protein
MISLNYESLEFETMRLQNCWCTQLAPLLQLAKRALGIPVSYVATYLYEVGFSALLHVNIKAIIHLYASAYLRIRSSSFLEHQ